MEQEAVHNSAGSGQMENQRREPPLNLLETEGACAALIEKSAGPSNPPVGEKLIQVGGKDLLKEEEKEAVSENKTFGSVEEELHHLREENKSLKEVISNLKAKSKHITAAKAKKEFRQNKKEKNLFGVYKKRKIALKLAYVGMNYQGLARQENSKNTIEHFLFEALERAMLIETGDRELQYSRAGRTDKGVSAVGNVVGLKVRTNEPKEGLQNEAAQNINKALDYVAMLNGNLPDDIRIVDYAFPENEDFNARYQCTEREYRYMFFENGMNIEAIRQGCQKFLGTHDFRNFCKLDLTNALDYEKKIFEIRVEELKYGFQPEADKRLTTFILVVRGKSFLWHQIRCMVAVLFMIGKGQESPSIIDELLDIVKNPGKPNYDYAEEHPLILYDCKFTGLNWKNQEISGAKIYSNILETLMKKYVEQHLYLTIVNYIFNASTNAAKIIQLSEQSSVEKSKRGHKKLMTRPKACSLEESISSLKGKDKEIYEKKLEKKLKYEAELSD